MLENITPLMVVGIIFSIFAVAVVLRIPVAFALILACLPFIVLDSRFDITLMMQRMYAGIDSFVLLAVPFFILAANIMTMSGAADRLVNFGNAAVGGVRGGLGVVNVFTSISMGGMSGSSNADVSGTGTVLIPQMVKNGYTREYAAAVTAASAIIVSVIPPSIQLIVWGSLTNTSIGKLFLGALIPGVLLGVAMIFTAWGVAVRQGQPRANKFNFVVLFKTFATALPAFGIIAIVFIGFRFGFVTATEAAVLAVLYALVTALLIYRKWSRKTFFKALVDTGSLTGAALLALAAASVLGYLLAVYKVPSLFEGVLDGLPDWGLLLAVVVIFLIVGMFMDALPAMAIMIPVFAPFVMAAGIDPVVYGVIAVMTLSVGLITPPYGMCLLIANSIAKASILKTSKAVLPFIAAIMVVLVSCIFFPQIITWLPSLGS